jgi:hypothetical protein
MADKLAWFHFYPGDWMKDPNLRRCSPAARGVLMDILCLMFECEERGRLSTAGIPWTDAEIAGAVNGESFASLESLKELESKCVLKRDEKGCLFSERLIRDEEIRQIRAKSGRKGGKASVKQKRSKPSSKTQANTQAPSDSDSVSDSSGSGEGKGCRGKGVGDYPGFARFWEARPRSPDGTNHPRWTARAKAHAKWRAAGLEPRADDVIRSLQAWKASWDWTKDDGQYIPGPEPWIEDEKFNTFPTPAGAKQHGKPTTNPFHGARRSIPNLMLEDDRKAS